MRRVKPKVVELFDPLDFGAEGLEVLLPVVCSDQSTPILQSGRLCYID